MGYNPANWYWEVAGDASRFWSSAAAAYVAPDNAAFVAWLAGGEAPRPIISEDELRDVLLAQYPPGWPPPPVRVIRSLAFRQRIPQGKRSGISVAAVQAAAATPGDGTLMTFVLDQVASTTTDLDDPAVVAAVNTLVSGGLLTSAEGVALLANGSPAEAP